MKLSSVKELIILLMYAVYMQNYNVTVLFKEKNLIFIPKNKLKILEKSGKYNKNTKTFLYFF